MLTCHTKNTSNTLMKVRTERKQTEPEPRPQKGDRLSMRLQDPLADRFEKVVVASRRSKTSIIEECLEKALPELERQYAKAA
jgi:hypothetical protein